MPVTVKIAIYDIMDPADPDHWAIFIDAGSDCVILQIGDDKGGIGYFVEEAIYGKAPQRSSRHKESIDVGSIGTKDVNTAVSLIQNHPVDNESTTWNCQAWAMEALEEVCEMGFFKWNSKGKKKAESRRQLWQ